MVGLRPTRCHTSSWTSSRMVQSFRVVIVRDGLSARLFTPGTYSATTECHFRANLATACRTGSLSLAFLDPLFMTDFVTVESICSKNVTG